MSLATQLSLFGAPAAAVPKQARPAKKASPSTGLCTAPGSDGYHTVYYNSVWIGSLYHVGQKVYSLYYPGQRGVCGFGFGSLTKAALELHKCYARDGKEVARG